jgi:hypothetical protein
MICSATVSMLRRMPSAGTGACRCDGPASGCGSSTSRSTPSSADCSTRVRCSGPAGVTVSSSRPSPPVVRTPWPAAARASTRRRGLLQVQIEPVPAICHRYSAAGASPPITIGGAGRCRGRGWVSIPRTRRTGPGKAAFPSTAARAARMQSSIRAPRPHPASARGSNPRDVTTPGRREGRDQRLANPPGRIRYRAGASRCPA